MCLRRGIALFVAGVSLACSEPPDKERHQAEGALAAARAAGAAIYAPGEIAAAEAALASYERAVAQGDYRLALHLAIDARDHAYTAARESGDEQATAQSGAEQAIADCQSALSDLQREFDRLPAADIQSARAALLQSLIVLGSDRLQEARTFFANRDFPAVSRTLTPFLEELRERFGQSDAGG